MTIEKTAFAYTRVTFKDKAQEQLVSSLNHHYLLSLLDVCNFNHYLRDHWVSEMQGHLTEFEEVLEHSAKINKAGKLVALAEVKVLMDAKDAKARRAAVRHFTAVFSKDMTPQQHAAVVAWPAQRSTDAVNKMFWGLVQEIAESV